MRRALPVIGLTATGVALVLNFDTRDATEAVTIDESASVAVVETSGPAAAPTTVSFTWNIPSRRP